MEKKVIGILVGSLRRESFSRKIAVCLSEFLAERFDVRFCELAPLPMYNQDLDDDGCPPPEWTDFRARIKALDGVLFVTPEYNRSLPAVLKNAIDVASRPFSDNAWSGKPGAVVSVAPGKIGGFGANHHLRQTAACVNIPMLQQPEAYVGGVEAVLDENGKVKDEGAKAFLKGFADAYAQLVARY